MPRKKGNNEGHIRRRSDQRWEAQISLGGNKRRSIYGKSRAEVSKKMKEILVSLDNGTYREPSRLTVSEWMNEWLETFCANSVKPLTLSAYQSALRNHIAPAIGDVKLQSVRGTHIQKLYNSMTKKGLSAKTVKNVSAILHKSFSVAIKQGLINSNPCDAAELPKGIKKEIKPLSDSEIPLFLAEIEQEPFRNAFALCLFAGLRRSECLGLSWDSVNFETGEITIRQQLQQSTTLKKYIIANSTKSGKARTIKPPTIAFDYLRAERLIQQENRMRAGAEWNNEWNLVFTNPFGRYISPKTFDKRFKKVAVQIGRPDARVHDLRHTAATVAISQGADIKSVQDLLGHSCAAFTLNVYAHSSEKMKQDTADRMQNYYANIGKKA